MSTCLYNLRIIRYLGNIIRLHLHSLETGIARCCTVVATDAAYNAADCATMHTSANSRTHLCILAHALQPTHFPVSIVESCMQGVIMYPLCVFLAHTVESTHPLHLHSVILQLCGACCSSTPF